MQYIDTLQVYKLHCFAKVKFGHFEKGMVITAW